MISQSEAERGTRPGPKFSISRDAPIAIMQWTCLHPAYFTNGDLFVVIGIDFACLGLAFTYFILSSLYFFVSCGGFTSCPCAATRSSRATFAATSWRALRRSSFERRATRCRGRPGSKFATLHGPGEVLARRCATNLQPRRSVMAILLTQDMDIKIYEMDRYEIVWIGLFAEDVCDVIFKQSSMLNLQRYFVLSHCPVAIQTLPAFAAQMYTRHFASDVSVDWDRHHWIQNGNPNFKLPILKGDHRVRSRASLARHRSHGG